MLRRTVMLASVSVLTLLYVVWGQVTGENSLTGNLKTMSLDIESRGRMILLSDSRCRRIFKLVSRKAIENVSMERGEAAYVSLGLCRGYGHKFTEFVSKNDSGDVVKNLMISVSAADIEAVVHYVMNDEGVFSLTSAKGCGETTPNHCATLIINKAYIEGLNVNKGIL